MEKLSKEEGFTFSSSSTSSQKPKMTSFLNATAINATAFECPGASDTTAWSRGDKLALLQVIAMPLIPIVCGLVQNMMADSKGRLFMRNKGTPDAGGATVIVYASRASALMKGTLLWHSTNKGTPAVPRFPVIRKDGKKATWLNVVKFKLRLALRLSLPLPGKSGDRINILPIHEKDIKPTFPS
ncbi:hypothetical protein LTR84_005970 [Exophiala bonariae]|uniref:Uncharacterized protein n=1 Tax=Exophiala bonariae TaxID=1690606 RepID=A0AAV9N3Q0_9EURO|nr:hypothetical protein LTR84_005970 [Exophiala bonariae]